MGLCIKLWIACGQNVNDWRFYTQNYFLRPHKIVAEYFVRPDNFLVRESVDFRRWRGPQNFGCGVRDGERGFGPNHRTAASRGLSSHWGPSGPGRPLHQKPSGRRCERSGFRGLPSFGMSTPLVTLLR